MQVYGINDSTQFGRLRIYPQVEKTLRALPEAKKEKVVESLEKASYELHDTKHCHLEIGEDLVPIIDSGTAERYTGVFNMIRPDGDYIQFGTIYAGKYINGRQFGDRMIATYRASSKEAAMQFYKDISKEKDIISIASKLTKFIESSIWKGTKPEPLNLDRRIDILMKDNDYYRL